MPKPKFRGTGSPNTYCLALHRMGVASCDGRPPHWCALTAPFHPCLCPASRAIGGLFSAALSARSPPPESPQHPALWSPDLPRPGPGPKAMPGRGHPTDSPAGSVWCRMARRTSRGLHLLGGDRRLFTSVWQAPRVSEPRVERHVRWARGGGLVTLVVGMGGVALPVWWG